MRTRFRLLFLLMGGAVLAAPLFVSRPAAAASLYLKTGLAHGEAAFISGLHERSVHDDDALAVFDIGVRAKPLKALRVNYDYQSKRHGDYRATDWDTHKLKLYWSPSTKTEI